MECTAGRAPDKTALVYGDERISCRALSRVVDRLARGFSTRGCGRSIVVVQVSNVREFVYTYFALARIGAIL